MNRRDFFKRSATPVLAAIVLSTADLGRVRTEATPVTGTEHRLGTRAVDVDGNDYCYLRSMDACPKGGIVRANGHPSMPEVEWLGVTPVDVRPGDAAWFQVGGPVEVPFGDRMNMGPSSC
mgnify:CR=1 FL=1